jgi:hypothetical protein
MSIKKILCLALVAIALGFTAFNIAAKANEPVNELTCWVLCQPSDYIHVRSTPSIHGNPVGFLDPGDEITISTDAKNGFFPILSPSFDGESYISCRYVSTEKPEWKGGQEYVVVSNERLQARKWIDGPRRTWLTNGTVVRVFYLTSTWAVTSKGFIKSQYLEEW